MIRHKKLIVVFVVIFCLSFLVVWDLDALRRGGASSQYDDGMAEVWKYGGKEGVFRVLFSRLRDTNEASYAGNSETAASEYERTEERLINEKMAESRAEMMFRSRFRSTKPASRGDVEIDDKSAQTRSASKTEVAALEKDVPSSSYPEFNKSSANRHPVLVNLGTIFNSTHLASDSQKSSMEVIKQLLLTNKTESGRALWAMAQQQQLLSKTIKPTPENREPQGRESESLDDEGEHGGQFHVRSSMSWPHPQFTRSDVLQSGWVQELKSYLETITVWRQVSVVTANLEHQEVVLNWLIAAVTVAKLPLKKILVLSLSVQLHDLLTSKKVNSVYIPPASVISNAGLRRITTAFNQIHIVRLTLFRLMSHWNYDVVMYDSDAVVLKDPQSLFDSYPRVGLIGSTGKGPESIGRIWGRTICTGVLLMRSSPALESWWEKMSQVAHLPFTDQGLVNLALKSLHVHWDQPSPLQLNRDMRGSCPNTGLQAVVLSEEKICRYSCDSRKRGQYYVWHKPAIKRNRTVENKKKRAREGGAWFLRDDWAEVSKMNSLTGVTWLLAVSHNT